MKILMGYAHAFLAAAADHAAAAEEKGGEGEVDGMMCAIALQNAFVGVSKVLGPEHAAVQACLAEVRDLKNVRDLLTHFDDYAIGRGYLQKPHGGADGPFGWMPMWNSPETILILVRRRGEETATHYEVALHDALRAVAALAAAALASLGMKPSALVDDLVSAD